MRVGGLLLAAGSSKRLGTPKQLLLDANGRPLVSSVVHALADAGCDPIVVVVGAHAEDVTHALIHDARSVLLVAHRHWSEGMGSTIRRGIASISTHPATTELDAVIVAACDMPTADSPHFASLVARAREASSDGGARTTAAVRVASEYRSADGESVTSGIPALFPRADWPALLQLHGDRGAKSLLSSPGTLTVALRDGSFDLDTPADVASWRASSHS